MTIKLTDDFNRADSDTVGNGWTESEVAAGYIKIESNTLRLGAITNSNPTIYKSHGTLVYPIVASWKISSHATGGRRIWTSIETDGTGNGFGCGIRFGTNVSNNVTVQTGDKSTSVQVDLTGAGPYYVWFDVTENGSNFDVDLYISTSSTKPGTPTASVTNGTGINDGDDFRISGDGFSGGQDINYDYVLIVDSGTPPAVGKSFAQII